PIYHPSATMVLINGKDVGHTGYGMMSTSPSCVVATLKTYPHIQTSPGAPPQFPTTRHLPPLTPPSQPTPPSGTAVNSTALPTPTRSTSSPAT
ncbi:MAG: hypothetical protein LQ349_009654, partial [Xanthoria aureola]